MLVEQIIKRRSSASQRKLMLDFCSCKIWDSKHGNKVIYFQMIIPKTRVKFEYGMSKSKVKLKYKMIRKVNVRKTRKNSLIQFPMLGDLTWNQMKRRAEGKQAILYDFSCLSKDSPAPARSSWQIREQENPYLERRNLLRFFRLSWPAHSLL